MTDDENHLDALRAPSIGTYLRRARYLPWSSGNTHTPFLPKGTTSPPCPRVHYEPGQGLQQSHDPYDHHEELDHEDQLAHRSAMKHWGSSERGRCKMCGLAPGYGMAHTYVRTYVQYFLCTSLRTYSKQYFLCRSLRTYVQYFLCRSLRTHVRTHVRTVNNTQFTIQRSALQLVYYVQCHRLCYVRTYARTCEDAWG